MPINDMPGEALVVVPHAHGEQFLLERPPDRVFFIILFIVVLSIALSLVESSKPSRLGLPRPKSRPAAVPCPALWRNVSPAVE